MREGRPYCLTCFDCMFAEYCDACGETIGVDQGELIGMTERVRVMFPNVFSCRTNEPRGSALARHRHLFLLPALPHHPPRPTFPAQARPDLLLHRLQQGGVGGGGGGRQVASYL